MPAGHAADDTPEQRGDRSEEHESRRLEEGRVVDLGELGGGRVVDVDRNRRGPRDRRLPAPARVQEQVVVVEAIRHRTISLTSPGPRPQSEATELPEEARPPLPG